MSRENQNIQIRINQDCPDCKEKMERVGNDLWACTTGGCSRKDTVFVLKNWMEETAKFYVLTDLVIEKIRSFESKLLFDGQKISIFQILENFYLFFYEATSIKPEELSCFFKDERTFAITVMAGVEELTIAIREISNKKEKEKPKSPGQKDSPEKDEESSDVPRISKFHIIRTERKYLGR